MPVPSTPRGLKIVHVCTSLAGAPWMTALMREQQKLGHQVAAVITGLHGERVPELWEGIPVYECPAALMSLRPARAVAPLVRLISLLRRLRPDVVHSHVLEAVLAARIASWIADVPRHFGGNVAPISIESDLFRPLEIGTAPLDTVTIASCRYTRELLLQSGVPSDKVALIHYAVDHSRHDPARVDAAALRRELDIASDVPVIGKMAYFYPPATAALFPQWAGRGLKGHDVFIRAAKLVLESVPDARFLLVGCGRGAKGVAYEQQMRELVGDLGIGDAVLFAGERHDVPETLAAFDISVQCSLTDNLGLTVESLLMERPTIASDIPGFADTMRHEETGLTVPADDPPALAAAIVRLLGDRAFGRRLGQNGRRLMLDEFSLPRAVAETEHLLARTEVGVAPGYRPSRTFARALAAPARLLPIHLAVRRRQSAHRQSLSPVRDGGG